ALWGSNQGRSLLDAIQTAEGLPRPAAYAFKGRDLHRDRGDLPHRDGRKGRSEQGESHASGKLHRASARHPTLRVSGRGDGGSTQQYWTVGDNLQRPERGPAPEAEVTSEWPLAYRLRPTYGQGPEDTANAVATVQSAHVETTTWIPFLFLTLALFIALGFEFVNGFD